MTEKNSSQLIIAGKIGFVPSECVSVHIVDVPVKSLVQAIKLAPFALEELLGQDIESLHFSVNRYQKQWIAWVCVTSQVSNWVAYLDEHNASVNVLMPDYFILPFDGKPALLIENGRALVRLDADTGFATDEVLVDRVLHLAGLSREDCVLFDGFVSDLAKKANTKGIQCNLLQGRFGNTISFGRWLKPWGLSFAASILGLAFYIGDLIIENNALAESVISQRKINTARFKELFPDIRRIVNPQAQASQQFDRLSKAKKLRETSLIALLQAGVPILKANSKIKVESIKYSNYSMLLRVSAPSVSVAETFNSAIQKTQGLTVKVQELSQDGDRVSSSLSIRKELK